MNWYEIKNIEQVDTPALVVYPERVKQNIALATEMIDNVNRLRPHVKTNKSKEAIELMLAAGISRFKCATIAEAELLAIAGAKDILLAYQPIGPKLDRFIKLILANTEISFACLTDNIDAATEMAKRFTEHQLTIPVYLDLNVGMNRTGIAPGEPAAALYKACAAMKGITPVGLHAYDGHIRNKDYEQRKVQCDAAFSEVEKTRELVMQYGFHAPVIIAGGSPSYSVHCKRPDITCSPGTFIYWDAGYQDQCPEQEFLPAALVVSRVISLPAPGRICVDLGHKSIAAENDLQHRVFFLNAPELKPVGQSEEHLVLETSVSHTYKTGDVLYGLPMHICPTVALYERALLVEDHMQIGEWKNAARDRRINY